MEQSWWVSTPTLSAVTKVGRVISVDLIHDLIIKVECLLAAVLVFGPIMLLLLSDTEQRMEWTTG